MPVEIDLKSVQAAGGDDDKSSAVFGRALAASGTWYRDPSGEIDWRFPEDGLRIHFARNTRLRLADLCVIALIARRCAVEEKHVVIELPQSDGDSMTNVEIALNRVGLVELLRPEPGRRDWRQYVRFTNLSGRSPTRSEVAAKRRFVPMRWVDLSSFRRSNGEHIFATRPAVAPTVAAELVDVLRQQHFITPDALRLFTTTIVLELGWNIVLHSADVPGQGYGIICARVTGDQEKRLEFCLADIGRGIPNTLRHVYERRFANRSMAHHHQAGSTEATGIVRFALEPDATSRPKYASQRDAEGFRGLAVVRDSIQEAGALAIRSDGGGVRLRRAAGIVEAITDDGLSDSPIPGTQIVGVLTDTPVASPDQDVLPDTQALVRDLKVQVTTAIAVTSDAPVVLDDAGTGRVVTSLDHGATNLIDIGFAEDSHKSIEQLCLTLMEARLAVDAVIWNVATPWAALRGLIPRVQSRAEAGRLPPLIVRGPEDARIPVKRESVRIEQMRRRVEAGSTLLVERLLLDALESGAPTDDENGVRVRLNPATYNHLAHLANTAMMRAGFDARSQAGGYYHGRIHLLSGSETGRFFSLRKHLEQRPANIQRWVDFVDLAAKGLGIADPDQRGLAVIGFARSVRSILLELASHIGRQPKFVVIHPYDVPSREELRAVVRDGHRVILVTDVLLTGVLASAIADQVRNLGGDLAGLITLVDGRQPSAEPHSMRLGPIVLPVLAGAAMKQLPSDEGGDEFYVDPVSLIPTQERMWHHAIDRRVEPSLGFLSEPDITACGHVIDGTRHGSTYVRLEYLLAARSTQVAELTNAEIDLRLQQRGWNTFAPTLVVFPEGASRVEEIRFGTDEIDDFHASVNPPAAEVFAGIVARRWPAAGRASVARTFDPAGRAVCAHSANLPGLLREGVDAVVVDDGLWSGRTLQALTAKLIEGGASRVLVVALLARALPTELSRWESLATVRATGTKEAQVCYVFPLFLPIPFYEPHDCPYEQTIARLTTWAKGTDALAEVAGGMCKRLEGRGPYDERNQSTAYVGTWLRLRVYVELVMDGTDALEQLTAAIRECVTTDEELALYTLFLEEWRLLGRARLRHAIAPMLRKRALGTLRSHETEPSVRMAALSMLRSLFVHTFVEHAEELAPIVVGNTETLGRAILHIRSLSPQLQRASECVEFLDAIERLGAGETAAGSESDESERRFRLLAVARALRWQITAVRVSLDLARVARGAMTMFREDTFLRHETRALLVGISGSQAHRATDTTVALYAQRWASEHRSFILERVVPPLALLRDVLRAVGTEDQIVLDPGVQYLTSAGQHDGPMMIDLANLENGLRFLNRTDRPRVRMLLQHAAARLRDYVFEKRSTLVVLLERLRGSTVGSVVKMYEEELTMRFNTTDAAWSLEVAEGVLRAQERQLLAPDGILRRCVRNVVDNVQRHAFPDFFNDGGVSAIQAGRKALMRLDCEVHSDADGVRTAVITLYDNGRKLPSAARRSEAAERLAVGMRVYGGHFKAPQAADVEPWTVMQQVHCLLW